MTVDEYLRAVEANPTADPATLPGAPPADPYSGQMSEGQANAVAYLLEHPEIMAQLQEEMAYADALRSAPSPGMRGNSRVQVAANPLEFLAQGYSSYLGGEEARRIKGEREASRAKMVDARKEVAKMTAATSAEVQQAYIDVLRAMVGGDSQTGTGSTAAVPPSNGVTSPGTAAPGSPAPAINPSLTMQDPYAWIANDPRNSSQNAYANPAIAYAAALRPPSRHKPSGAEQAMNWMQMRRNPNG